MSGFFKSRFFIALAIFTVVVLIFMMFSTIERDNTTFLGSTVGAVVTPVQKFFWGIGDGISGFFTNLKDMASYKEKYEAADEKVHQLEKKTRDFERLQAENDRLRRLLDLKNEKREFDFIGAEIVAKDSGNWYNTFVVDKGSVSGVKKHDIVVTDSGVVGYIYEVGKTWGKVMSIIDSNSAVGAVISRTGDRAVVEGDLKNMEEGKCKMSYIAKGATLVAGDYIETSGLGGIYPEGLLIGKVESVSADANGLYNEAVVETAVNFSGINEVMIIRQKGE